MIKEYVKKIIVVIVIVMLVVIAGLVCMKFKEEKSFNIYEKQGDDHASQEFVVTNNLENQNNAENEELQIEEKMKIEEYVNKICNQKVSAKISEFNDINGADKVWIYSHLNAREYEFPKGISTEEQIIEDLQNLFGTNLVVDVKKDTSIDNVVMPYYNEERELYEFWGYEYDLSFLYAINSMRKVNNQYVVNVVEYIESADLYEKYSNDLGMYVLIYSGKDYEKENKIGSEVEDVFKIERSKLDSEYPSKVLNEEVLRRKEEFLSYDITLEKDNNQNLIVKKINKTE